MSRKSTVIRGKSGSGKAQLGLGLDLPEIDIKTYDEISTAHLPSPLTPLVMGGKEGHGSNSMLLFPLHTAAQKGNAEELEALLQIPSHHHPLHQDYRGRTALHHAANYGNQTIAMRMTTSLLYSKFMSEADEEDASPARARFLNIQDEKLETALHLAAKNGHGRVVQQFLFCGADVNLKSKERVEPIELIYKKVPQAMRAVFDTAIRYRSGEISADSFDVLLDFGPIVGYPEFGEEDDPFLIESALLVKALKSSQNKCKEILIHPLVQLFLHFKWKKVRPFFWFSILFHITWLVVFSTFLLDLYLQRCPFLVMKENTEEKSEEEDTYASSEKDHLNNPQLSNSSEETILPTHEGVHCSRESVNVPLAVILATVSGFMLFKELYELCSVPTFTYYFKQMENVGQLVVIVTVGFTTLPVWILLLRPEMSYVEMHPWQYQAAAVGIFLAWLLILCQVGKTPRLGIYVEILLRVLKSFGLFVLTFTSLLIAFALSFSILMPQNIAFSTWPLALSKVLIMMAGELNYDEIFFTDGEEGHDPLAIPFRTMGHILFALFVITVTIILFNLLIGLTVSDIQGLQEGANLSILSSQLEQIYLMESFLFSKHVKRLFKLLRINPSRLRKFQIAEMEEDEDFGVILPTHRIPPDLQLEVKELAAQNLSSDCSNAFAKSASSPTLTVSENNGPTIAGVTTEELRKLVKEVLIEVLRGESNIVNEA